MINETLSPTWDEVLVFEKYVIYGNRDDLKDMPPIICIEYFDVDIGVSLLIANEFFLFTAFPLINSFISNCF